MHKVQSPLWGSVEVGGGTPPAPNIISLQESNLSVPLGILCPCRMMVCCALLRQILASSPLSPISAGHRVLILIVQLSQLTHIWDLGTACHYKLGTPLQGLVEGRQRNFPLSRH